MWVGVMAMRILKANERHATDFPILGDFDAGNSAPHGLIGVIFEEQSVLSFMLKAKRDLPMHGPSAVRSSGTH